MQAATFFIFILSCLYLRVCSEEMKYPEDELITEKVIIQDGYPLEVFPVTTKDGYILTLYHIPHGLKNPEIIPENRSIVLLLPGMVGTARHFLILGKRKAAAYYFADKGLDVWLYSPRGVKGSFIKKHTKYNWNKDPQYWFYSLAELGAYDIPATIDFILNYTNQEKLSLIGHSSGGYAFFSMLSVKPQYNDKVKVAIGWGVSPILRHMDYPVVELLALSVDLFKGLYKYLNFVEAIPYFETVVQPILIDICTMPAWKKLCILLAEIIGSHKGFYKSEQIRDMLNSVTRISSRLIFNFMDNIKTGNFSKYDYGPKKNMKFYGQKYPPAFNLSAVTAPVAFFVGPNDGLITRKDVLETAALIPNPILIYDVPQPNFNHLDFIASQNATELVYKSTYRFLKDIYNGVVYPSIKVA